MDKSKDRQKELVESNLALAMAFRVFHDKNRDFIDVFQRSFAEATKITNRLASIFPLLDSIAEMRNNLRYVDSIMFAQPVFNALRDMEMNYLNVYNSFTRDMKRFAIHFSIDEKWKSQLDFLLKAQGGYNSQKLLFDTHMAKISEISVMANSTLFKLPFENIGSTLQLSKIKQDFIKQHFLDLTANYSNLLNTMTQNEKLILSYPPAVSLLPARIYFNEADFVESISSVNHVIEIADEKKLIKEEIQCENDELIGAFINYIDKDLLKLWEGIKRSWDYNNPDNIRHISVSSRELLRLILNRLAPDQEVLKWPDSSKYLNGKGHPTRKAKILYIGRSIENSEYKKFIMKVSESIPQYWIFLNENVHNLESKPRKIAVGNLIRHTETFLLDIIEIYHLNKS